MNISIIDAIILLFILLGGVIGFKEGAIKKLTSIIGLILVVVISFKYKNYISVYFYENLPFFNFWGIFKGVQVINILLYEMLAFILLAGVLMLVYRVLLGITGLIEKVLKATVILSIPSKILGFIIGLFENYIWVYLILFIMTLPIINIEEIYDSKFATKILSNTPVLSKYTNKTVEVCNDIYDIIDNKENKENKEINQEALEVMLKHDMITTDSVEKLIKKNRIILEDDSFLDNYK